LKKSRFHTDEAPSQRKRSMFLLLQANCQLANPASKPSGKESRRKGTARTQFLFANADTGEAGKARRKPRSELGRMLVNALEGPLAGKPYQSSKRGKMFVQVSASACSLMQRIQGRFVVSAWQSRLGRGWVPTKRVHPAGCGYTTALRYTCQSPISSM